MREVRKSMRLLFTVLFFITLACSSICISPLYAGDLEKIHEIVVFGDSLSDTGNLYVATMPTEEYPDRVPFPASPPYDAGRFSNGLVWVEYLAQAMGGIGEEELTPSNWGGTNYAWGGAETGYGIAARNVPNIGEQINSFLASNQPKDSQLFIIWAGANDFDPVDENTPLPKPKDIVDNIIEHIRTLALASPDTQLKLMIPNLPSLGQTPRAQCLGSYDHSIPWRLEALSREFNAILNNKLKKLIKELEESYSIQIILYKLDIFSLFQEMLDDPESFELSNVSDTVRIGTNESGCPLEVTDPGEDVVDDADGYLFFDAIHPTTIAHEIIAERALELIDGQIIETEYAD